MAEGFELITDPGRNVLNAEILAVHAALLRDGTVLYFSGSQHDEKPLTVASARVYNPSINMVQVADSPLADDLFCCGHAFLANGDLFVAGGTATYDTNAPHDHQIAGGQHHFVGIDAAFVFRLSSMTWQRRTSMAEGRWYPTCVALADGRILVISGHGGPGPGHHENTRFEIYHDGTNSWTASRETYPPLDDHGVAQIYYPRLHLLPGGKLFCASTWMSTDGKRTRMLDPDTGTLTTLSSVPEGRHCDHVYKGANFSSALLPLEPPHYHARVFICGGKFPRIFDMQSPSRGWEVAGGAQGARPYDKRAYGTAVLLPDGSVLIVNGCESERGYPLSGGGHDNEAVLFAERYIPDADYWPPHQQNTWEQLSSSVIPRVYHSVALLVPDGRVWIAGSNHDSGRNRQGDSIDHPGTDARELRMEMYSPPYLDSASSRPKITGAAATMKYTDPFVISTPDAVNVSRVALIRAGSVTHGFNFDQRYVGLEIQARTAGSLTMKGPPDAYVAPAGVYMLFVIDGNNIPSVGRFVTLINPPPPPIPAIFKYFLVDEHHHGDWNSGVDLKVGDRLSVVAEGEIYAGVWFTGNNGPWGWDGVTSDSKFPYRGAADSHPYSLLGKIGSGGYFLVGASLDRRQVTTAGRLFLRINDDCHGNGNGSFRGWITVYR